MPDTLCRRAPHASQWIAPSLPKAARSPRLPWRAGEKQQACGEGSVHTANPDVDCKLKGAVPLELQKRHRQAGMAQHGICTIWWMVCARTVPALAHHRRALPLPSFPSPPPCTVTGMHWEAGCVCVRSRSLVRSPLCKQHAAHSTREGSGPCVLQLARPMFFPRADQANLSNARLALSIHQDMQTIHLKMARCRPASHSGLKLFL
jgi:hypothetical protein